MATLRSSATVSKRLLAPQRLALVQQTECSPAVVLALPDAEIDFAFFRRYGVGPTNFASASLGPAELNCRGVTDPAGLQALGFDALHFANPVFCEQCVAAFGAASVIQVFLKTPQDAVALAGMPAIQILNLTTERLLQECAGAAVEAMAVLKEQGSMENVRATTLLDTGLRAKQLTCIGYTLEKVRRDTVATPAELEKLGV